MTNDEFVLRAESLGAALQELLKGNEPEVIGAALADVVSIWLVGHAPALREDMHKMHIQLAWHLVSVNEARIFGPEGHPAGKV